MKYRILRTDKANDQLYDLIHYIADDSGDVDTALRYLDKLEQSIMRLGEFPLSGTVPHYSSLKKRGYRVLIVERHLIFYKVDEAQCDVTIYAIVDARMEYKNLI